MLKAKKVVELKATKTHEIDPSMAERFALVFKQELDEQGVSYLFYIAKDLSRVIALIDKKCFIEGAQTFGEKAQILVEGYLVEFYHIEGFEFEMPEIDETNIVMQSIKDDIRESNVEISVEDPVNKLVNE